MLLLVAAAVAIAQECKANTEASTVEDLTCLSLSDLANVEVTSVSKSSEPLQRAPASIYVISRDDIARSSATNVSISGNNLLHARHAEFPAPSAEYITRSVFAETRWRF